MLSNPYTGSLDVSQLNALRDDQFALIEKNAGRYFPTNSHEETLSSCESFGNTFNELSKEARSKTAYFLKQASAQWGIPESDLINEYAVPSISNFVEYNTPAPMIQKRASHTVFALEGKYPIDSPELVKQAGAWFTSYHQDLSPVDRRTFAINVKKAADMMSTKVEGSIEKFASQKFSSNIYDELKARENCALVDDKQYYQKLAGIVDQTSPDDFVYALHKTDEKCGLQGGYNKLFSDPQTSVIGIPKAASTGWTTDLNGVTYTEADLKKALDNPQIVKLFGESMIAQMKKDSAIFDSLPKDHKEVILTHG